MKIIIAYIGINNIFNISASLQKKKGRFGFLQHSTLRYSTSKIKKEMKSGEVKEERELKLSHFTKLILLLLFLYEVTY